MFRSIHLAALGAGEVAKRGLCSADRNPGQCPRQEMALCRGAAVEKEGSGLRMSFESKANNRPSGWMRRGEGKGGRRDKSPMFDPANRVDGDHFPRRARLEEERVWGGKSKAEFQPLGSAKCMLGIHGGREQLYQLDI